MPGLFLDIKRLDHEQHSSAFEGMFFVRNWIGEVRALASKWHVEGKCRSTGDTLEFEAGYLGSLLVRVWDEVDKEDIVLSRELRSYMSEIKKWISQVNVQRSLDAKEVMAPLTSLGEVHQGVPPSPACQVFDEIPKPIDANPQEIERLDQISTSTAETVLSTSFIKNPSFVHSGNPRKAIENLLHLRSTNSMDLASKMDDTCVALGELPIDLDDDVDSSATPAISASVTTNCNDLWSGEQFTRDFKVSFGAESGSQCVSSNLSELPQPSVCVSFLDEHVQAVQVISIPLSNNMNLRYMADVINMELRVDVLDCGIDDMIEQTNQFNMSLNPVTLSYASKVFDRMPNRVFGLRSEELCSAAVHILLLQASSNGSCTLWPNKCRLVFEPGGHRALFVTSLPWNWRQVAVKMIHQRLQWDPGDRLLAGSESLHCSLVRAALVQRQVGKIIATRTDSELRLPCCQTGFHFSDMSSAEPEALCFIGFDARQRANSTLEDFCRSYFLFQEMDSSSSSALFRYLPVLSFTLAPEFAILLDTRALKRVSVRNCVSGLDHMAVEGKEGCVDVKESLYPAIEPYSSGFLKVSDVHSIYWEQSGNPDGYPVVFLHGGPGGGTSPSNRSFFDPEFYRIILFDQRGSGKSIPHACLEENTTWDLVADIETLREHLEVPEWQVFGGSWGSTLALAYSQAHPDKVTSMILRGIFMLRKKEIDWFYEGGTSAIFPDSWEPFRDLIPENERDSFVDAYHKRLNSDDLETQHAAARAWTTWELMTAHLLPDKENIKRGENDKFALAFARIENHYFVNKGFFPSDSFLLDNIDKIRHIKTTIVQGRYDVVCPMMSAWDLHKAWPEAEFIVVPNAGHSANDPPVTAQLVIANEMHKRTLQEKMGKR